MAKKSAIEKNNHRRKMVKKAASRRTRLKAIVMDKTKPVEERFAATLQACRDAAQFVGGAHPQSLRTDGPSARLLSQAQAEPHRAP